MTNFGLILMGLNLCVFMQRIGILRTVVHRSVSVHAEHLRLWKSSLFAHDVISKLASTLPTDCHLETKNVEHRQNTVKRGQFPNLACYSVPTYVAHLWVFSKFVTSIRCFVGVNSSVGLVAGLRDGRPSNRFRFRRRWRRDFLVLHCPDWPWGLPTFVFRENQGLFLQR
jgi:hypothetical protein